MYPIDKITHQKKNKRHPSILMHIYIRGNNENHALNHKRKGIYKFNFPYLVGFSQFFLFVLGNSTSVTTKVGKFLKIMDIGKSSCRYTISQEEKVHPLHDFC